MDRSTTEIICIIDRSGSMASIRSDAIGGFNSFLDDQKAIPGPAALTLVQFDNTYEVIYDQQPINEVAPLDNKTFVPRGTTALLDAIGRTIDDVGHRLSKTPMKKRPSHVIVGIMTDGFENASTDYTREQVFRMITHQKTAYKWDFIFMAANQDAIQEGGRLGISSRDTYHFRSDSVGTRRAYKHLSRSVRGMRLKSSALEEDLLEVKVTAPEKGRANRRKEKS
jgi:uncharacterized protein YegL